MKKIMILVAGILLLAGSSVALMPKLDLVDTTIQVPSDITNVTYVLPPEPRFMNCTVNFSFTVPTPFIVQPSAFPVNWTIRNNTDGTPFIVTDFPVNITRDTDVPPGDPVYLEDFSLKTPFVDY